MLPWYIAVLLQVVTTLLVADPTLTLWIPGQTLSASTRSYSSHVRTTLFDSSEQWWPKGRHKIVTALTISLPGWVQWAFLRAVLLTKVKVSAGGWQADQVTHNSSTTVISAPKLHIWVSAQQQSQQYSQNLCRPLLSNETLFTILQSHWSVQSSVSCSLVPRPSPAPFSWSHTWPQNCPEKRKKAWYIFYVIKPQGGHDQDVCGLSFSNYGNVPTHITARPCEYYW